MKRGFYAFFLILALGGIAATPAMADTFNLPPAGIADYIVQVVAHISTSTPSITLEWPQENLEYFIYRKSPTSTSWGAVIATTSNTSTYVDTDVATGTIYEYRVAKDPSGENDYGYIYSGMDTPLVENRGKVVLIVDSTIAGGLSTEISQLESDLIGDGWQVLRHDVARDAAVSTVRALIVADYNADPSNVKSVLLLGHVPVPYSGEINPDGHAEHLGAWPADVYYGDVTNNTWTDSTVNTTSSTDSRNHNIPADGKFDQNLNSGDVKLAVGRIDMYDMPAFAPDTETDLLRQYLNRDHAYRFKNFTPTTQALIVDNLFEPTLGRYSQSSWAGFSSLVGAGNIATTSSGGYLDSVSTGNYLWTYGSGSGSNTSAAGIGNTADFASTTLNSAFNFLLGSYFGDWDSTNNFLRAPLAATGNGLTSAWSGLPMWYAHHMGMGETIGYSALASQNNGVDIPIYFAGFSDSLGVHIALMGDPTLRLNMVAPPATLIATDNGGGDAALSWTGSVDSNILGYYVYRSTSTTGPFTRISDSLTATTTYTDTTAPATGSYTYMIRAVKLETTPSGSYYNASNGIFDTVSIVVPVAPTITTSAATTVTANAATLNGSIDATGGENPTERGFYYGQTNLYGSTTTESGSFSTSTFSTTLSSLTCGTTYHFKAWASNPSGGTGSGSDASFTTSSCDPTPNNNSSGGGGGGGGGSSAPSTSNVAGMPSTPEGLRAKIAELLNLISILRARLGLSPISPVVPGATPSLSRNLNLGDTGEDVRGLQRYLNAHGFFISSSGAGSSGQETAYFGPATRNAVARFQAAKGIAPAAGYFGPATRAFINSNP